MCAALRCSLKKVLLHGKARPGLLRHALLGLRCAGRAGAVLRWEGNAAEPGEISRRIVTVAFYNFKKDNA